MRAPGPAMGVAFFFGPNLLLADSSNECLHAVLSLIKIKK